MAGIGVKLNKIFDKRSLIAHIYGFGYSAVITVAPMFVVIGTVTVAQLLLGYSDVDYFRRELFADTVLYIFIFALLSVSPFNALLSQYLSDVIFEERYEDIIPCYYLGLAMSVVFGSLFAIPFCVHEHLVGQVPLYYVFTGYCGFMALLLVFYSMLYLSITKDYARISGVFLVGMLAVLGLSLALVRLLGMEVTYALLLAMTAGFLLIASLEIAIIQSYFRRNSRRYKPILEYFRKYWQLVLINFLYTLGLYAHNFVFWTTDMHTVLVRSFVTRMSYDMATFLAMFTNLSATVIFISRVEMRFHSRYRAYSEAVIGGRGRDIQNSKQRMFRQLGDEIQSLVHIQFIVTVVLFLLLIIFLPWFGVGGETMRVYPGLCVGYFILFTMYSEILFLYYYKDMTGALWTTALFFAVTVLGSILSSRLSDIWYGMGLVAGSFAGFTMAYFRLRWVERHLDAHIFCSGALLQKADGPKPSGKVFDRREEMAAASAEKPKKERKKHGAHR